MINGLFKMLSGLLNLSSINLNMSKISEIVKNYLDGRPFLMFYITEDIVNIRGLARKICEEHKIENSDAVMMAIRRYIEARLNGMRFIDAFNKIKQILRNSNYAVHTGYTVGRPKSKDLLSAEKIFHIKFGEEQLAVVNEKQKELLETIYEDVAVVVVEHPKEIEDTPGVVSYLYFKFFERSINILETFSCLNITFVVVNKQEVKNCIDLLENLKAD